MAQERPATPEKQLLKLIEDSKVKNTAAVRTQAIKHKGLSLLSLSAWISRLSFFKDRFADQWLSGKGSSQLDVKIANAVLTIISILLLVVFIFNIYFSTNNINTMPNLKISLKEVSGQSGDLSVASGFQKASSAYLDKIRERDIFRMGPKKVTDENGTAVLPSDRVIEATQHLRLVGISWSNDPDAMIEDTKALRTFFVKRGQMIGEVKVRAIFKDKVVLSFAGEEIELR